jgi:hypothetical protein
MTDDACVAMGTCPRTIHHRASSIALAIRFLLGVHFLTLTRLSVSDSFFSQLRRQRILARLLARLRVLRHLLQRVAQHRLQLHFDIVLGNEEEVVATAAPGMGGTKEWTSDSGWGCILRTGQESTCGGVGKGWG